MSEVSDRLKERTMRFALDVCALIRGLPGGEPSATVKHQLTRAATGVAFNYRATCRARSHAEFTAKIGVVSEEADEAQGWLEFLDAAGLAESDRVAPLLREATELVKIMSAAHGTARFNRRNQSFGERVTE
jgi:four helix bundle protein